MNRKVIGCALAACAMFSHMGGALDVCAIQETPAATLLLPYFEVDLSTPYGKTTQVTVGDAMGTGGLVEAVVWTDLGVPIFSFDFYLNPYQDIRFDMRTIFESGILPSTTAPASYPSCSGVLPPATIPSITLGAYQEAFLGQPSSFLGGNCGGRNLGDTIARGYVTFDVVNYCTLEIQTDPGVWGAGGTGLFSDQNLLYGDFQYVTTSSGQTEGHSLVHIVADSTNTNTSVAGKYTFWGATNAFTAGDNREPLATIFAAKYVPAGTSLIVWRDPKQIVGAFKCGTLPPWYPLGQEGLYAISDSGTYSLLSTKPFPAVAQKVVVGSSALPTPYSSGWFYLDLNTTVSGLAEPPFDSTVDQAWVMSSWNISSSATVGNVGVRYDSACNPRHFGP
jgi:hypothetical protein